MNKHSVYSYICELEKELISNMAYQPFSEIIVSEIINHAIITLHELPGGLTTDERTAKDLVLRNIRCFFTPLNISNIVDKFQNWDKRVCYGHRGRHSFDTKTMIEFKLATDSSLQQVKKLEENMLEIVRNFSFKSKPINKSGVRISFVKTLVGIILIVLTLVGIYSYSISNRYQRVNASTVFDNWTGKSIDVYENMETE